MIGGQVIAKRSCSTEEPGAKDPIYASCLDLYRYQSLHYHRPQATDPKKSHWCLTRDDECHTFCRAKDADWCDNDGNLWFVHDDARELGTAGERVATYPRTDDGTPWHGYPVAGHKAAVNRRHVPHEVLRLWHEGDVTTRALLARLWKRQA
jgi:hypothetical protein